MPAQFTRLNCPYYSQNYDVHRFISCAAWEMGSALSYSQVVGLIHAAGRSSSNIAYVFVQLSFEDRCYNMIRMGNFFRLSWKVVC